MPPNLDICVGTTQAPALVSCIKSLPGGSAGRLSIVDLSLQIYMHKKNISWFCDKSEFTFYRYG